MSPLEASQASPEALEKSQRRYQELGLAQTSYPDVKVFPAQFGPHCKPGIMLSLSEGATSYDIFLGYGAPPHDIGRPGDVYIDGVKDPSGGPKGILYARLDPSSSNILGTWIPYNSFDKDAFTLRDLPLLRYPEISASPRFLISDRSNGIPIWLTKGAVSHALGLTELYKPSIAVIPSDAFTFPDVLDSFFPSQSAINSRRIETEVSRRQEILDGQTSGTSTAQIETEPHPNKKRRISGPTGKIVIPPRKGPSIGPELQTTLSAPPTMRRPMSKAGQSRHSNTQNHIESPDLPTLSSGAPGNKTRTEIPSDSSRSDDDQLTYPDGDRDASAERVNREPDASLDTDDSPDIRNLLSSFTTQLLKTYKDSCDLKIERFKRKLDELEQEKTQLTYELAETRSQHETETLQLQSDKQLLQEKLGEAQKQLETGESDRASLRQNLLDLANNMQRST